MNYTATLTRDRPDAVPDPRKAFMTEEEHRAFTLSKATLADWRDGTYHQQQRDLAAEREAQSAENEALRPFVEGNPPNGNGLTGWKKWRDAQRDEVDRLESAQERLRKHIMPTTTAAELLAATQRGAQRLLAAVGILDAGPLETAEAAREAEANSEQLAKRLEAEKRASAEAVEALRVVEGKLAFARKALAALDARESEFLDPHLRDYAKIHGRQYMRKVAELQEIAGRAFAAREMLHQYGDAWGALGRVSLPRPLGYAGDDTALDLRIKPEDTQWWAETRRRLLADPSTSIKLKLQ
jgi:hypothetical protein